MDELYDAITPETEQFILERQHDDVRTLALQAKRYPGINMPVAIRQIAGRQTAQHKIPSWYAAKGIIYPLHLSLEQCSSELTARYKAGLLRGETLVDLTGGFGVDCAFLSANFKQVTCIERQEELCNMAAHNFNILGLHQIVVVNKDSVEALADLSPVDCIFIDPARRDEHGGKTVLVSDCEPDAEALEDMLLRKAGRVMIKLSPMLDLSLALRSLPHTCEVHVVSVRNECKELLLLLERRNAGTEKKEIPICCVDLAGNGVRNFTFTRAEEASAVVSYTHEVDAFLYEPHASILKAGAFRSVAARFGLKKLHPNSHLYTSDHLVDDFPGKAFCVQASSSNLKEIIAGVKRATIVVRNFPVTVAGLRKRSKLREDGGLYLFATTLHRGNKVYIMATKAAY
ncbi:MAG: RsmD family RNA methyltransferase [Mediterranea sp.]|jgi:hypothetical protein|nr:RsmD family RNA methyltransferase [Mediterranea sp.]